MHSQGNMPPLILPTAAGLLGRSDQVDVTSTVGPCAVNGHHFWPQVRAGTLEGLSFTNTHLGQESRDSDTVAQGV